MAAKKRTATILGFTPTAPQSLSATLALASANTWLAFSFVLPAAKTLSKVKFYCSAIAGTQANIAVSCSLYSDTALGLPNAAVETVNIAAGAFPAGGNVVEFTGFTTALTANVRYWIVLKNASGNPTVDYPTIRFGGAQTGTFTGGGLITVWGWSKNHTTDGGTTWPNGLANVVGMRLEFATAGGFDGIFCNNIANTVTANAIYAARERGVKFVTPADAILRVLGLVMSVSKGGAPSQAARLRLYNDTTLLATSGDIPVGCITGYGYIASYFSAVQVINPGTTLRAVVGTTGADSSSNRYMLPEYEVENNADSQALFPWSAQITYLNGTWADDPLFVAPFGLILDPEDEFGASGGAAGMSRAQVVNGA